MHDIEITGAAEGSLKNISLKIPKNKLVAFTGVSGCGKSTLLIDVLFNECQRQYLEAMAFQGIQKPKVQRVRGASPAIVISQAYANKNPRSTVGTLTDTYTDLRMLYEKLGARACPHCGSMISAADCREETEKRDGDFYVYMYCSACGRRMDKLTRTFFSFNTKEGACPVCEGLGRLHTVDREKITDESLSLKEGAVRCWEKQYAAYQTAILGKAFSYYGLPASEELPVGRFSTLQKAILYEGTACEAVKNAFPGVKPPKNAAGRFEGVAPMLRRRLAEKNGDMKQLESYFKTAECPACRGERLCGESRAVTVNGVRLPQLSLYSLEKLYIWAQALEGTLSGRQREMAAAYLDDLQTKLNRLNQIGLLYLTLDRQTVTLSGGELQRLRLAAALDSELSGVIYILDEPTAGLHPKDTAGLAALLARLRDLGNTVLVIEHDADIIARADHIVDMGPGSGQNGGEIVAVGTPEELRRHPASVTGRYLARPAPGKASFRKANEYIHIENADVYNLKNISVHIPVNCLTCVAGPSGSGKSTLIFEVLAQGRDDVLHNRVTGLGAFGEPVMIGQAPLTRMRRSNVATYIGVYGDIRSAFAKTEGAKKAGLPASYFSFNTPGGRCERCQGLGRIENNMLFFADTEVVCPACGGSRFSPPVLAVSYQGRSIRDVLEATTDEAAALFAQCEPAAKKLRLLQEVGLGYLQLGQTLTTLSGGEAQRLKLAKELALARPGRQTLYLMDEPTAGLHPQDVEQFLALLDRIVAAGGTVVVAEHNPQLLRNSDFIIELGPRGGEKGGYLLFEGTPEEIKACGKSVTAAYL